MRSDRERYGLQISKCLEKIRYFKGWTIDDLALYLKLKPQTLRNAMSTLNFSYTYVSVFMWAKVVPEELAYNYQAALERENMEKRKKNPLKLLKGEKE